MLFVPLLLNFTVLLQLRDCKPTEKIT